MKFTQSLITLHKPVYMGIVDRAGIVVQTFIEPHQNIEISSSQLVGWTMKKSRYEYAFADDIFFRS